MAASPDFFETVAVDGPSVAVLDGAPRGIGEWIGKEVDRDGRPGEDCLVSQAIDDALQLLTTALTRLEAAVGQRFEAERDPSDLEIELALMSEDRARLAAELDAASARLAAVEAASEDVGRRLGRAITAVEGALTPSGGLR